MALSHETGPHLTYGPNGPCPMWGGVSLFDPRKGYSTGQDVTVPVLGWSSTGTYALIDQVPAQLAANNIAASQTPTANVALTLVSSTGAGITVGASVTNIATGLLVNNLLAIDGPTGTIAFGQDGTDQVYDPRTLIARAVRVVSAGNDSGATFTVRGYDIYGQPMAETITGANAGTATGLKAFKYIASITPAGTLSGSAVTAGTTDVIGFPLFAQAFAYMQMYYVGANPVLITSATGYTAPVTTSPATATTGDVRGTYTLQSASDGTNRLIIFGRVAPYNLAANASGVYTGLFGVANFTS